MNKSTIVTILALGAVIIQTVNVAHAKGSLIFSKNTVKEHRTGLMFPGDMPAIRFPTQYKGCSSAEKQKIDTAWAMAHYFMWRADQTMDWLASNGKKRKAAWSASYVGRNAKNSYRNHAPRAWFGPYDGKRFTTVDKAIEKVFTDRFRGKTFKVFCRVNKGGKGAHPCYQKNPGGNGTPGANHIVYGKINFCKKFFNPRQNSLNDIMHRARGVVHEVFHHLRLNNGLFVTDTHVHCHKGKCVTDKGYGRKKATHLSHYKKKGHYKRAIRNTDNYALFAYMLGRRAYEKTITKFPSK